MSFCLYNKKNICTAAWRYEFYFLVAKTIFYSLAELVRKILFCYSKIKFISSRHRVISSLYIYMSFCITVLTIMNQYSRIIETIRLRFFGVSCESRRSRSHVTRPLPSGFRFEVHVCTGRPRSRGKFCTLKHHNPKTNMAAASYHPRIWSPKYGQTGKVKPLTANHSLKFAVQWPNLHPKVSNEKKLGTT